MGKLVYSVQRILSAKFANTFIGGPRAAALLLLTEAYEELYKRAPRGTLRIYLAIEEDE